MWKVEAHYHTDKTDRSEAEAREEIAAEIATGFNTRAVQRMAEGSNSFVDSIAQAFRTAKAKLRADFTDGKFTSHTGVSATFDGLNQAEKQFLNGMKNAMDNVSDNGEVRYSPIKKNSKGKYVQADRQVITSNNPDDWEGQIYDYINNKIRNGQDVVIPTDDGDDLTITEKTAWKMGYRNRVNDNGTVRPYNNKEYRTKINAAAHIDELAEISKRGKKNYSDTKNHGFAQNGFNYRTAYFRDLDGLYYRLIISVGENSAGKTVYNIGDIKKASFPDNGSKTNSKNAVRGKQSSKYSISENNGNVNRFSIKEQTTKPSDSLVWGPVETDEFNDADETQENRFIPNAEAAKPKRGRRFTPDADINEIVNSDMTAEERQANFPESMKPRDDVVFADSRANYSFDDKQLVTDFKGAVNDILNADEKTAQNNISKGKVIQVLNATPNVILDNINGSRNLPVIIRYDALYLAARESGTIKGHYHNIGADIVNKLPQMLSSPDAIIKISDNRINLISSIQDNTGKHSLVSVELNSVKDIDNKNTAYNV